MATRMLGVPAPQYRRLATFRIWWKHLSAKQKAQSIYGTLKRVFTKGLYKRAPVQAFEEAPKGSDHPEIWQLPADRRAG